MAEPESIDPAYLHPGPFWFHRQSTLSARSVYEGIDGRTHDLEHGCGAHKGWFVERSGPNIGMAVWLDCADCGHRLYARGLAIPGDTEFCERLSADHLEDLIDGSDTDTTDVMDADDAWDEYVESMRADKREQFEDEYLEEMSAAVDERINEWVADLENDERDDFIERYRQEHEDDDDEDEDED